MALHTFYLSMNTSNTTLHNSRCFAPSNTFTVTSHPDVHSHCPHWIVVANQGNAGKSVTERM